MYLFIVGANIQKNIYSVKFSRKLITYHILKISTAHLMYQHLVPPVEAVELHTSTAAIVTELEVRLMGVLFVINT